MTQEIKTSIAYNDKVIAKIVGQALENIDGLLAISGGFLSDFKDKLINSDDVTDGVNVEVGSEEVAVDLKIVVEYGKDIPQLVDQIKALVAENIAVMTRLNLVELNVKVVDVKSKEEHEQDSVTLQDKVTDAAKKTGDFASQQAEKIKDLTVDGIDKAKEVTAEGLNQVKGKSENN
ncbi:Asp23/Gls24 family envelope stress response protein [Streptococcus sp. sy004]|uniref:Asp23/Gls24 family envelope stress response protein n=1 Tax=Streptococcus sp. sy004 TaxID=2600149 RepID=UPI0011B69168|nr:Asp23/Gls24 family envelope stress response protein [Streptococcus sp. sy004]TWT11025.1 Asp23/Gls24 family envelope stress response protein [Streptococcus sp. sy004]